MKANPVTLLLKTIKKPKVLILAYKGLHDLALITYLTSLPTLFSFVYCTPAKLASMLYFTHASTSEHICICFFLSLDSLLSETCMACSFNLFKSLLKWHFLKPSYLILYPLPLYFFHPQRFLYSIYCHLLSQYILLFKVFFPSSPRPTRM